MTRICNSSALVQGSLVALAYYRCSISSAALSINQEHGAARIHFTGKPAFLSGSRVGTSGLYRGHPINSTFIRHLRSIGPTRALSRGKHLFFRVCAIRARRSKQKRSVCALCHLIERKNVHPMDVFHRFIPFVVSEIISRALDAHASLVGYESHPPNKNSTYLS